MIYKRSFAWACLALVLVAEIFLFRANREQNALRADLSAAQTQLHQTQATLAALQNSDAAAQANEILRLKKLNEILTNKLAEIQTAIEPLQRENASNAQHLATARLALQLQQQHLQELQTVNSQIVDASTATVEAGAAVIARKTCINNLRLIDDAKQQWAADNNAAENVTPTVKQLQPYCPNGNFPTCPSGGNYFINAVNEVPTCSIPGHALPQ